MTLKLSSGGILFCTSSFKKTWRLGVLALAVGSAVGCVPIRQTFPKNKPSGSAGVQYLDPKDYKKVSADAWKNEMEGLASWYGEEFNGRETASGEIFDMNQYTAAHKTLSLGTVVKVLNLENGKSTEVRINDRGPFVKGRIIDLSRTAARAIGLRGAGTARVKLEVKSQPK